MYCHRSYNMYLHFFFIPHRILDYKIWKRLSKSIITLPTLTHVYPYIIQDDVSVLQSPPNIIENAAQNHQYYGCI